MFLNLPDGGCASISMPGRQADLFEHAREFVGLHVANGAIRSMVFVSTLVNCGNEVSINGVEVNVLGKIKFVAREAQRDQVVEQRWAVI